MFKGVSYKETRALPHGEDRALLYSLLRSLARFALCRQDWNSYEPHARFISDL